MIGKDNFTITAVSPDRKHIDEIIRALDEYAPNAKISTVEARLQQIGTPPDNKGGLDVLVVDCSIGDISDLEQVERLSKAYQNMAFILYAEHPSSEFLIQAMRAGVREVLPFPVNAPALKDAIDRIRSKHLTEPPRNGKVLAFCSCKGGSGATFLACNLAYELASREGVKVALFDLNLQFGDALLFLSNQRPKATVSDVAHGIHRLDQSLLATSMVSITPSLGVLAAPEDPTHAEDVTADEIDALIKLARTQYDFVIIDVGRSLNSVTIKALDLSDMIFPIVQMTLPFIRDGKRLMDAFSNLDYPKSKLHLIVNRYKKDGDIQLHHIEQLFGLKVFRTVPNHYESVAASVNQGVPIAKLSPRSPVSKSLNELADSLTEGNPNDKKGGWWTRILSRAF